MANQIVSMTKLKMFLKFSAEGKSLRQISELTNMSRNTLFKYKEVFEKHPLSYKELQQLSEIINDLVSTNGGNNGTSSNLPPSSIDCDRGNIQEDIILPNLSTNSNHLLGFRLSSFTEFLAIDNQPCKLPKYNGIDPDANTSGQNLFNFMFTWVIGRDGGIFGTRNLRKSVLRSELVSEVYQVYVAGWKWHWLCGCMRPIYRYRITGGVPKFVSLNIPLFSTVSTDNHWTTDNQGEAFWINVKESEPTACSSTNFSTWIQTNTTGAVELFLHSEWQ